MLFFICVGGQTTSHKAGADPDCGNVCWWVHFGGAANDFPHGPASTMAVSSSFVSTLENEAFANVVYFKQPLLDMCAFIHVHLYLYARLELGAFGGSTLKPIYGWSNDKELLEATYIPLPAGFKQSVSTVCSKRSADGVLKVRGDIALKTSQSDAWPCRACNNLCMHVLLVNCPV